MRGQLVDLDLAKLADIANLLALERAEVLGDAGVLEVDDAGEGLVEKRADGDDGEVAGFGLVRDEGLVQESLTVACISMSIVEQGK